MLDGHVTRTRTTMELFLVLVSLLFVTRCGKTTAEESAPVVINMVVREGDDAVLSCSLGSRSIKQELFDWKKDGQKEVFMYNRGTHYNNNPTNQDPDFRGRVFHFAQQLDVGNASVVIRPTKVTDSGSYTCDFPFHQPRRRSHIVLVVGAAPKPFIRALGENEDGIQLQCEVLGAFPKPVVQWQDRAGNIIPAEKPQVSERGGSYDIILQTTVTKTDYYQCVATQEEIKHRVSEETYVSIPVPGAAPKPYIITLSETDNGVQLQCEVLGAFPKPVVQWKDRAGNIVPAEEPQVSERRGSYDVILQTTVTKTDYYQCVATQKEIKHRVYTETLVLVPVPGASPEPIVKILAETDKGVQVHCAVKGAFPKPVVQWKDRAGNIVPAEEPQVSERRGSYDVILQTTVTKTDYYQCVATQKEIEHRVYTETLVPVHVPGNRSGWIVVDFWRGFCLLFFWLFFWL
uniref:butyrophilin-like protein 2 isoform X1 n=1 Tax=Solea senegalensis TaxID=28829 RepID=UPI001CD896EC|nr:butyrophilin-like protein 2 isoform X1 [Solea senegalensis]